jgi:hypothetical protein
MAMSDLQNKAPILQVDMSKPSLMRDILTTATEAYKLYPTNCSGSVYWVIINLVDPAMPALQANQMLEYFANPKNGWQQVADFHTASTLANNGKVVVAGKAEAVHGHVIIVLPGPWKPAGGYAAINRDGQPFTTRRFGLFPPAMSTAWSTPGTKPWAGAMSNGDKTIYDPWSDPTEFKAVTFWTKNK